MQTLRRTPRRSSLLALAALPVALVSSCTGKSDGIVDPTPTVRSVTIQEGPPMLSALGQSAQLTVEVLDDAGGAVASPSVGWTTSNATVASVSAAGLVSAQANGAAVITASVGSVSDTVTVTVAQLPASVEVSSLTDTLTAQGETTQMNAVVMDASGFAIPGASGTWTSSDEAVVTVDGSGLATAVAEGSATVSFEVDGVSGSAALVVTFDAAAASVSIALDNETIFAQGGVRATATVRNAPGGEIADLDITWTSSDPSLTVESVEIDGDGRSTALLHSTTTLGTFWIRAETPDAVIDSVQVTVVAAPAAQGISIDFETLPGGGSTCTASAFNGGCNLGDEMLAWGVSFRWTDATFGGDGIPNLVAYDTGKQLVNDRSSAGFLTGSHQITMSVDVATFSFRIAWPAAASAPPVTVTDTGGSEITSVVLEWVEDGGASARIYTIYAPVLIGGVKIGPGAGLLYLDDLVY